jgi:RNA 3'-terminal phosphate cyclase (ATP)
LVGDVLDSTTLEFRPMDRPRGGDYEFDIAQASSGGRSAGAVTLLVQAILWPLFFSDKPSRLIVHGGTFVPHSPPYHYLAEVAGPGFMRFGVTLATEIQSWGWMSGGGGSILVNINPADGLDNVHFQAVPWTEVWGIAAVTNLASHIPHRMARRAHNLLAAEGLSPQIKPIRERGAGPGAGIVLWGSQAGFSSLGHKGLPAEEVAEDAVAELLDFLDNGLAVDHYLADQLLLPMALAKGSSSFTTSRLTQHTLTVVELLRTWLDIRIDVTGSLDEPGEIIVNGYGMAREK